MQRFAVIGLGRFGAQLARSLTASGAEVIAIDKDRRIIDEISDSVTYAVRLDSTNEEALRAQGVDKVNVAIVGIGQDFESSILTTVILKGMKVTRICCRAEKQIHGRILRRVGADEIILPEEESAQRWSFKLMAPRIGEKLEFAPGFSFARYNAPASFHNKTILELNLRKKYNVNLIGLHRAAQPDEAEISGQIINVPLPETIIHKGDVLWLVGSDDNLASMPDE